MVIWRSASGAAGAAEVLATGWGSSANDMASEDGRGRVEVLRDGMEEGTEPG